MAWDTELVLRLRYTINDIDSAIYTDNQLKTFICLATIYVNTDVSGYEDYSGGPFTVSLTDLTITPDPSTTDIVGNIIVAKAACIIAMAEYKKRGISGGWKITDDRSTIDGTEGLKSAKEVTSLYCNAYQDALGAFLSGSNDVAYAILSPYSNGQVYNHFWGRRC